MGDVLSDGEAAAGSAGGAVGSVKQSAPGGTYKGKHGSADTPVARARPRSRSAVVRLGVTLMVLVFMAAAGVLTHFDVGAGRVSSADQRLMRMQRMGPPPVLQPAYEELSADAVAVRNPATKRLMATGTFVGTSEINPTLPGVASILPGSVTSILRNLKGPAYDAVFVVPLMQALPRDVIVDVAGKDLPGTVAYENSSLDLAAVKVPVSQDQLGNLVGPPVFFHQPASGRTTLRRLIIYLGPAAGAGYVYTSGVMRSAGLSQCDATISRNDAGSPVGWVSLQGTLVLAGLAIPSGLPGQCRVIGSWSIAQFLQIMVAAPQTAKAGAFLGVIVNDKTTGRRTENGHLVLGAYVTSVVPGSPAARAGVRPGDVVVRLDDAAVKSGKALVADIRSFRPETLHRITLIRAGRLLKVNVKLGREGG